MEWYCNGERLARTKRWKIDAAFVPFDNQENWEISPYSKYNTTTYTNVRLGTENQIVRGNNVRRIGQTTGITTGEIRSTNVSVNVDGVRITNTFRYTNDGQGGDSGGPIYFDDGTNLFLLGLHFASGDVFLGGRQGIACRIRNIMRTGANGGLDVTPITNDSFVTNNLTSSTVSLNGINFNPSGALTTPTFLNGRTVTRIGNSAFNGRNRLTRITIPSTVTHVESDAFKNTNNASIYLTDRTIAPSTFNINWNSSSNPVYLNGVRCTHSTKTLINISTSQHAEVCDSCRTTTNIASHAYVHTWFNYQQHRSACSCGSGKVSGHVVSSGDNGYPYKTCLECGGPAEYGFVVDNLSPTIQTLSSIYISEHFGNDSYILSNGVIVLSDIDLEKYFEGTLVLPNVYQAHNHDCVGCLSECTDCDAHCHESLTHPDISKDLYISINKEDYLDFKTN